MIWYVIGIILAIAYVVFNIITAKVMSAKQMKHEFIDGQCIVGKIFANLFYSPAWLLKAVKAVVVLTIA